MNLFVPGRICLFGEHSDWAGGYRRINADLEKGFTIITGTNQGIHAEVKPHPTKLIMKTTLFDGTHEGPFELPMETTALLAEAEKGGFLRQGGSKSIEEFNGLIYSHYELLRGLK